MKYVRLTGLLIFVVLLVGLDFSVITEVLSKTQLGLVLIAIALNAPMVGLKAWRWQFLLGMQGRRYSVRRATIVYFSSLFAGFLTPGRLGEFAKVLYLAQDIKMPISEAMSSVLADRLFDLYALLISGGIGLTVFSFSVELTPLVQLLMIIVFGASIMLIHPRAEKMVLWILGSVPWLRRYVPRLQPRVGHFYAGMANLWRPPVAIAVLLTAAAYLVFFTQNYLLAQALGLPLDFGFVAYMVAIASLVTLIPISISGLGTRDAILVALFNSQAINAEFAVAYSTLILVTFFIAAGSLGALAWWAAPLNPGSLQQTRLN